MEQHPLVSVIIPVYNVEKYLADCIQSVQKQTLRELEMICVEDCSTDGSAAVLTECAKTDERIKILQNQQNMGLSCVRNRGMEAARGKYLMFLDSDDLLTENALKELYDYAEQNELNGILFDMDIKLEGGAAKEKFENVVNQSKDDMEQRVYQREELLPAFAENRSWKMEAVRYFWRREILIGKNLRFYPGLIHEDNLFSFYAWMEIDRIAYRKKKYYIYRKRDNSIMFSVDYRYVESLFVIWKEILDYWKEHTCSDEVNAAIKLYLNTIYQRFRRLEKYFQNAGTENLLKTHPADQYLFEKLVEKRTFKYAFLSDDKIEQLQLAEKVIIYGAGVVGEEVLELLEQSHIKVDAVAVTNVNFNMQELLGHQIRSIDDLAQWKDKAVVLLAAVERHQDSMLDNLQRLGFQQIMFLDKS
jgi:glycosyltransferase involved in cell wall biosynthesis